MNVDTDKYDSLIYMAIKKLSDLGVDNIVREVIIRSVNSRDCLGIFLIIDDKKFGGTFSVKYSADFIADVIIQEMLEKVTDIASVTDVHGITKKYLLFDQEPSISWGREGPKF